MTKNDLIPQGSVGFVRDGKECAAGHSEDAADFFRTTKDVFQTDDDFSVTGWFRYETTNQHIVFAGGGWELRINDATGGSNKATLVAPGGAKETNVTALTAGNVALFQRSV